MEDSDKELVINSIKKSGLIREYGIATSLSITGQQWLVFPLYEKDKNTIN
jgi:hypothetical protein